MSIKKSINALSVLVVSMLLGACAQTAVESDFGNSVRAMVENQTANPNPPEPAADAGDGVRLQGVTENYRSKVGDREGVRTSTQLGLPSRGN